MAIEGMKVAIAGGSIAGCATAIALSRAGCDVTVFERSSSLQDRGSGIAIPVPLRDQLIEAGYILSLIHISEPTRPRRQSRMPSSA